MNGPLARAPRLRLALCVAVLTSAPAAAWRRSLDGITPEGAGRAMAVARDSVGQVIAAGSVANADSDFTVAKLDAVTGAEIWRRSIDGSGAETSPFLDEARAVAVDGANDVIAAGGLYNNTTDLDVAVVKLAGTTGTEVWRREVDLSGGNEAARAVAVDVAGDVVAAGSLAGFQEPSFLLVIKLSGVTGAELWRVELQGTEDAFGGNVANSVTVDGAGNVIVGGSLQNNSPTDGDFTVLKLAGATGAELWRREIHGVVAHGANTDAALAVAADGGDDVIAVGRLGNNLDWKYTVVKFATATGAELWRQELDGTSPTGNDIAFAVSVDAAGDVLTAGQLDNGASASTLDPDFAVVKFAGTTGAELWRRAIKGTGVAFEAFFERAVAVAVDGSGDVLASGTLLNKNAFYNFADFTTVKLAGASGATLWQQAIDGASTKQFRADEAFAVTVDAAGNALAAGTLTNPIDAQDFTVVRLGALDGAVGPLRGTKLLVRDQEGDLTAQKLVAVVNDQSVVTPPAGGAGDPTVFGATLRLQNPVTLEMATISLPAASWSGLGIPPGSAGYRYRGGSGGGPCTTIVATPGRQLKTSCNGRAGTIAFSLDEAIQGTLVASLQLGSAEPQCAVFGPGSVTKDVGIAGPASVGLFKATRAVPASGACP